MPTSGTWDSSSSNWDWNGSNTAFVHTDNVRFSSDADMTLAENLQANTLTVDEGRRLNLSGDGTVLTVNSLDGTGSTALGERLRTLNEDTPLESITLIGLCTDICVISNALLLRAYLPEVPILVDAACCAGVTPESHKNALAAMKACQITVENEG